MKTLKKAKFSVITSFKIKMYDNIRIEKKWINIRFINSRYEAYDIKTERVMLVMIFSIEHFDMLTH